ncbi:MAG: DUF790 family protein [Nitrososphaerales archaeon]
MLPLPLLRSKIRKGKISPLFSNEDDDLQLAKQMVNEFQTCAKSKERKGSLLQRISTYETGHDYKLVRGLYTLLERRCMFVSSSNLDPVMVRREVFEEASRRGFALTGSERDEVLSVVAGKLGVSSNDVEEAMWSDLEENLVLEKFDSVEAHDLIASYNLSLIQTLLFNCTKFEFYVYGGVNWKHVLRLVKRLGLMYYLENKEDEDGKTKELVCSIEGPLSLFKLTDRYGTSIAKLVPSIIASDRWYLKAWIVKKGMSGRKMYEFDLSYENAPELRSNDMYDEEKEKVMMNAVYDSSVEEKFAKRFEQLANGWKLVREPDPVVADGKALIPDFAFEKYGRKVYLEIVGFWTKEYLERKVQKLLSTLHADILIAVNEELACSKFSSFAKKVFFYKNEVPVRPVIDYLKSIDAEMIERSSNTKISIDETKEIIPLEQIAEKHNIPLESVSKILAANTDYMIIGKYMVSKIKAKKMEELLEGMSKFIDACSVLEQHEIPEPCHADLISVLGYDVVWNGLDAGQAYIRKRRT